jgi:ferredoxin
MLDAAAVKELGRRYGADLVGIASLDRFEGAPKQFDPRYIMPKAKSLIVCGFRIMRGSFRGVEEGTLFTNYSAMGYGFINQHVMPLNARYVAASIEDEGYEAIPLAYHFGWSAVNYHDGEWKGGKPHSKPVEEGKPHPDVMIHVRIAAYLAGLGEIGYSKVFLTPEFGPRVRFGMVLTELELEPDPIMKPGTLCNRCMACVRECPGALSPTKTVKVNLAGNDVEWAELDWKTCSSAFRGAEPVEEGERGTFLPPGLSKTLGPNEEAFKPAPYNPFYKKQVNQFTHGEAICAGKGCMRACMISLERRNVLKNKFKDSFRTKPLWTIDWSDYDPDYPSNKE